jgi:hypothetical protein
VPSVQQPAGTTSLVTTSAIENRGLRKSLGERPILEEVTSDMTNSPPGLDSRRAAGDDQSKEPDGWCEALLQAFLDARDILLAPQRRREPEAP